jgi:hypothetical protein
LAESENLRQPLSQSASISSSESPRVGASVVGMLRINVLALPLFRANPTVQFVGAGLRQVIRHNITRPLPPM